MKKVLTLLMFAAGLASSAQAHFIWLELPPDAPGTAQLRFSEEPGEATDADMQKLAAPMTVKTAAGAVVSFEPGKEALEAQVPKETALLGGTLAYGVLDKEKQGRGKFLLMYYAKGARDAGAAGTTLGLPVEVTAQVVDGKLLVEAQKDGKPAAKAELTISLPGGIEKVIESDAAGKASLAVSGTGWIGVRAMVAEERAGTFKEDNYALVRHYATLTFWHGGAAPAK